MRGSALKSRLTALAALLAATIAGAQEFVTEVYRDPAITVAAGLAGGAGRVIHLGDALELRIVIAYDPRVVAFEDLDESLFESAWPPTEGIFLRGASFDHSRQNDVRSERLSAAYEFQVLDCPESDLPTCPGDRVHVVPRFRLDYVELATGDAKTLTFQPVPGSLTVMTTIQRDADNQLFPFEVYFPNGGFPDPQTGHNGTRSALLTAGFALALLTGGFLMWPFRSRTKDTAAATIPRWQKELSALRQSGATDDARFLDRLRRCLVWYCNDELGVDAFIWLDLAERGDDSRNAAEDDKGLTELRDLFVELLHSPAGRGDELSARLEKLIAQGGHA